jgi:hypothetical protein
MFTGLGYAYKVIFLLPCVGEPLVRGICKSLAFMSYHSPVGVQPCSSIAEFRTEFENQVRMSDLDVEISYQDTDKLEIIVNRCPYGYSRPGDKGVCEAAMDMDRKMFGYCGVDLIIDECMPDGHPVCRISFRSSKPHQ